MFRIHRHKSDRSGEKFDFRISQLSASQVPKGWDRLVVSLVLIETGKTVAKSNKAVVNNGSCNWNDLFRETIWVSQDDTPKESEEGHLKFVIYTVGSPRSAVLGEAVLNLTSYANKNEATVVSLPLKRCTYGTTLQFQVQGATAKIGFREGLRKHLRDFRSLNENQMSDMDDLDGRSEESDNMHKRNTVFTSGNYPGGGGYQYHEEPGNMHLGLSASGSHCSLDSGESFVVKSNISPKSSMSAGAYNVIGRQDSTDSAGTGGGLGDEMYKSNNPSLSSKASGLQWHDGQNSSNILGIQRVDSSKELLEAAQETIEELRGEARMWEKTARKLKNDLESLRKEFSDQANHMGELEKELLASCSERESLKADLEQLKTDESTAKLETSDSHGLQGEDMVQKLKELEQEVKFQKESNATLSRQLNKTQESNYELLSILQELEETIEKQRAEIANFSAQIPATDQSFLVDDLIGPEKEDLSDAKEQKSVTPPMKSSGSGSSASTADADLVNEMEELRVKVVELERDCAELTEENIELLYKLKELKKDAAKTDCISSHSNLFAYSISSKDGVPKQSYGEKSQTEEILDSPAPVHFQELVKRCTDLETELQAFKDRSHELGVKLQMTQLEVDTKNIEINDLQLLLQDYQKLERVASGDASIKITNIGEDLNFSELSMLLGNMYKELQKAILRVKNPWFENDAYVITESGISINIDCATLKEKMDAILCDICELDKLLSEKIADCNALHALSQNEGTKICDMSCVNQQYIEDSNIAGKLKVSTDSYCRNISPDPVNESTFYQDSVSISALKEEIGALKQENGKLELLICQLNGEKVKLEKDLETTLKDHIITSQSLDNVEMELLRLTNAVETQVSANQVLERNLLEHESGKHELEINLSELEQENIHLSECISGLEAQLRYMTSEKESNRLELENSKSLCINLRNEMCKLETELESQKSELQQNLQETHKRLLEAQEEYEILKGTHSKFEGTIENLIDESSSLQKLNGDLRKQKLDLHEKCTFLEVELSKSQEKISEFLEKIGSLESALACFQKDADLKEKSLISQLEILCQESKNQEEKLLFAHTMLKKMDTESMNEAANCQQRASVDDENSRIGSHTVHELSVLRAEKSELENTIQEFVARVQSYEVDIHKIRNESEEKLHGMIGALNASKQSEEMLIADVKHLQMLIEDNRCREENVKKAANELELQLKAYEIDKEQMKEDMTKMKLQLQKVPQLQEDVISLKSSLDAANFEKGKIEATLQLQTDECDELRKENKLYMEKITAMQKSLCDSEYDRASKVALEEKLLRLECDLTAREALFSQEVELKNEVNSMKITNSQYQLKIQSLELEKDELTRRIQDLEASNFKKDEKHALSQEETAKVEHDDVGRRMEAVDIQHRIQTLEKELTEALQTIEIYRKEHQNFQAVPQRKESKGSEQAADEDGNKSRLSSLESELKDMKERYSEMSLKYAEVQAEREELVLMLKSSKTQKRWF